MAAMIAAIPIALPWPRLAQLFPLIIAPTAIIVLAIVIFREIAGWWKEGGVPADGRLPTRETWRELAAFASIAAVVALAPVIGQQVVIVGFVLTYLLFWGRYSVWLSVPYAAGAWLLLHFLYGSVLHVLWIDPLL